MADRLHFRRAAIGDEDLVLALLHELAVYERLTSKFRVNREIIARDFVGPNAKVFCDLASVDGEPAGLAVWHWIYGTFAAAPGIYLEDLYVREKCRGKGYGKAIMAHLARIAADHGASEIKWAVLNWNAPSIAFYDGLGAEPEDEWTVYSLSDEPLARLARP